MQNTLLTAKPGCGFHPNIRSLVFNNLGELYQLEPHKAVAEVSKIANYRRLVAVNHGSRSKSTDGSRSGGRQRSVVVVVIVIAVAK